MKGLTFEGSVPFVLLKIKSGAGGHFLSFHHFFQLLNAKSWFLFIICPCVNYQVENEILLTLTNILHLGYRDYPNCSTES